MSNAANMVRSLIFVAIFKILNVKKIFEFNKMLSYSPIIYSEFSPLSLI